MNPVRLVAATMVAMIAGVVVAFFVVALTRPSDDDLQRAALDEVGLSAEMVESPLFGPIIDEMTERVGDRVIAESRSSVIAGVLAGVVTSGAVVAAEVWFASSRRRDDEATSPPPDRDVSLD